MAEFAIARRFAQLLKERLTPEGSIQLGVLGQRVEDYNKRPSDLGALQLQLVARGDNL